MNDDRFDRDLGARLRAYESRLPDADAPAPGTASARTPQWPFIGLGALAAVAAVIAVAVLLSQGRDDVGTATPSPSPSASPTPPGASATATRTEPLVTPTMPPGTASPSPSPSPSPAPATADLAWVRTASFPVEGGLSWVDDVTRLQNRYVAVGVEFVEHLPVFGRPPPHEARAWTSADGRSWQPVDLGPGFENVQLRRLIQRADGTLLALGARGIADEFGISETEPAAWTTADGLSWDEVEPPLGGPLSDVEQGLKGVLAVVIPSPSSDVHEVWLSADGLAWERVHSLEADYVDIGAGDEGFVAVGWRGGEEGGPFAIASADGRAWVDGETPSFSRFLEVASHGGDWIVVDDPGGTAPTWFSANGLAWAAHGEIPFRTIELDDNYECREYRSQLTSAGPWLVTTSELTYPCSESGFMVHGTQYLSVDGATWLPMPLAEGTPGENRSGSSVGAALATDHGLILVGEENGAAAFWFGEAP
jgi:hypothetical protein